VARAAVPPLAGAAYLAALLALDRYASYPEQLLLGALTWTVLGVVVLRVPAERRAQALGVVVFATVGEVTGSLIWGVYTYRLHNLPLFVPPAHGLVYLTGLALAAALARHARVLVLAAAVAAASWGLLGLTVLPRRDVAGAVGVPLLLLFLWRGRNRAIYAAVFLVVASLELYGTVIGTWHWAQELPGLGIPDGNPPSGVASGYVRFDVMALLTAPLALTLLRRRARSEQRVGIGPDTEVRAPERGDHPAARGALEKAELQQVRLVDVFDRLRLFPERHRERREPDRAAAELLDHAP
jgi:hypothetical protein